MWKAQHESWCKDQSKYLVIREYIVTENAKGETLESNPMPKDDSDIAYAECACCRAKARDE